MIQLLQTDTVEYKLVQLMVNWCSWIKNDTVEFKVIKSDTFSIQSDTFGYNLIYFDSDTIWYIWISSDTFEYNLIHLDTIWYILILFNTIKYKKMFPWAEVGWDLESKLRLKYNLTIVAVRYSKIQLETAGYLQTLDSEKHAMKTGVQVEEPLQSFLDFSVSCGSSAQWRKSIFEKCTATGDFCCVQSLFCVGVKMSCIQLLSQLVCYWSKMEDIVVKSCVIVRNGRDEE